MSDSDASSEKEISEQTLKDEIKKILEHASLKDTSTRKVIQQLEKKFDTDLSSKKTLIDNLVMDYVNSLDSEESGEDEEEESEEEVKVEKKTKAKPKGGKKAGGVAKRGKGSGYTRAYKLSPALSELVGATELPRHEVVKRVWAIIKERQLTDPNNRQYAICDKPLYKVIGTKRFYTFGMMKYLKNHFLDD